MSIKAVLYALTVKQSKSCPNNRAFHFKFRTNMADETTPFYSVDKIVEFMKSGGEGTAGIR